EAGQRYPLPPDLIGRRAAVEHLLAEPPPRPLPQPPRIDRQRVQHDHQRSEAAERRLGLRVELLCEREIALHPPLGERLLEDRPPLRRGERDERRRKR